MTDRRRAVLLAAALGACLVAAIALVVVVRQSTASPGQPAAATSRSAASSTPSTRSADGADPSSSPSASTPPATTTTTASAPPPLGGRTVVLDPGHNRDNGQHPNEIGRPVDAGGFQKACNTTGTATDAGLPEATINWELALAVQTRLQALGATVVLTREVNAGWGPCIDERAAVANRAGADLLLSLHADGAAAGGHGFHVILPGSLPGWTDDIAAESGQAAVAVRDALVAAGFTPSTYIGSAGLDERTDLGTLNRADVPAVMLEAGNLRNAEDAALLSDPGGRARVADALTAAVADFLSG